VDGRASGYRCPGPGLSELISGVVHEEPLVSEDTL
jgi:hypothetical protein